MADVAFKVENINKTLGKKHILHDISFEAYKGEVFGFLGPNGAGKTTTIKMAVGMLSIDDGAITVNGKDVKKNFEKAMEDVGAIVENPEMHKFLTGMQNLKNFVRIRSTKENPITQARIDEVVALVKLSQRINDKVKAYSLGMRQRLGVAQALLHNPAVLILDEPTNGRDPAGIKELRDVLKTAAHKENRAVIVSSHLMSEMELMCDRVGIIVNGKMVSVQTLQEFTSSNESANTEYKIEVDNVEQAVSIIKASQSEAVSSVDDSVIHLAVERANADDIIADINKKLVLGDIRVKSFTVVENKSLEDAFIEITNTQEGGGQIE